MAEIEFKGQQPKKPLRIGTVETIDVQTGKVIDRKPNAMMILPPKSGCQECGDDHPHDQPHNQQSLVYQYQFHATHGRWPTWTDAMAHCPETVREQWRPLLVQQMKKHGMEIPEDLRESQVQQSR